MEHIPELWSQVEANWLNDWAAFVGFTGDFPLLWLVVRMVIFVIVVMATIAFISSLYRGAVQGQLLPAVAIRDHSGSTVDANIIRVPPSLVEGNIDTTKLNRCRVYYIYQFRSGVTRKELPFTINAKSVRDVRAETTTKRTAKSEDGLIVSETSNGLGVTKGTYYGHTLFPEVEAQPCRYIRVPDSEEFVSDQSGEATPETIGEYFRGRGAPELEKLAKNAEVISFHRRFAEQIEQNRRNFLMKEIKKAEIRETKAAARAIGPIGRLFGGGIEKIEDRVQAHGSYQIRFSVSRNPLVVLSSHPDRDLRMTAWLTVLTSLFSMLSECTPLRPTLDPPGKISGVGAPTRPTVPNTPEPPLPATFRSIIFPVAARVRPSS
jgi:hypothetical protein